MKKILYFTADWCGPCASIKPQMQELSAQLPITFINVDVSKPTADHYMVRNIPCVVLVDSYGNESGRIVGTNINKQTVTDLYNR